MDNKEAITELTKMLDYENYVFNCIADDNEPETVEVQRNIKSLELAIKALEKVPALEAENAKGFTYHFPFRINQKIWYITEWDKYSLQKNHVATIRKIHVDNGGISFSVLDGKNYHTFKLDDIGTNVFLNKKDWHNARMKKLAVKR